MALDLACVETIVAGAAACRGPVPEPQPVAGDRRGAGVQRRRAARHPGAPRLPARAPRDRAHRAPGDRRPRSRARPGSTACREAGIRIAADDIGAGNAGLRLLAEISFDVLKVDLGLVQRSSSERPSRARCSVGRGLRARTGALVIAEGVEHAAQLAPLTELGIDRRPGLPTSAAPARSDSPRDRCSDAGRARRAGRRCRAWRRVDRPAQPPS